MTCVFLSEDGEAQVFVFRNDEVIKGMIGGEY